jgi:hypothetical protein
MIHWIADRFSGVKKRFVPSGQKDIEHTRCP